MQDQRAHSRKLLEAEAAIADPSGDLWITVPMLDISRMGIAFSSPAAIEGGATYLFRIDLPGIEGRVEALLRVVHSSNTGMEQGFRVGARFASVTQDDAQRIVRFLTGQP